VSQPNQEIYCYPIAERVFDPSLSPYSSFLSYSRKWNDTSSYKTIPAPLCIQNRIQQFCIDTFRKIQATGYVRFDLRMNESGDRICVIDVNANASLGCEEGSSLRAMLDAGGIGYEDVLARIILGSQRSKN